MIHVTRGDLFYADLNPSIGSEQGGIRPVLIVQNDVGNTYSPTTIIASLTSKYEKKHFIPTHYYIHARDNLNKNSTILLEQIRCIDKTRLLIRIGKLSKNEMLIVDKLLRISLSL